MALIFSLSVGSANGQQQTDYPDSQNYPIDNPNKLSNRSNDLNQSDPNETIYNRSFDSNRQYGNGLDSSDSEQSRPSFPRNEINRQPDFDLLPPDQPTEFQQMVKNSTGKLLPIYGADLFRNSPSTFAPVDKAPVTPDYVIGPGDELMIQVWGQVTFNSHLKVDRLGSIYIPQVGTIHVSGVSFGQLQEFLKSQMSRVFRNFDLNVNMGQLRSIQIFVVGQARRPGSYTISSLSTLVNALFATGGPTPLGSLRDIQVKRSGTILVDFDLYSLLQGGDKSKDVQLLPGDVIYIPPVGPQVAVAGNVNSPGIYELKKNTESTVAELLHLASGETNVALDGDVRLERIDAHRVRSVVDLSANDEWRTMQLRNGDILQIASIADQYKDAVILRGNVANPGHFAWKPGMRISDLLPDKDALVTRDYWLKRERLGMPVLTYLTPCPKTLRQPDTSNSQPPDPETKDCITRKDDDTNSASDAHERATLGQPYGTTNGNDYRNDRKEGDGADQPQRAGSAARNSTADAAVAAKTSGQFEPQNDVSLIEPDIDWSYAVIERQDKETLTTSLLPFDLGRLVLQGDATQNLALQPNDVVTIFSKADIHVPQSQQTRLVRLEGEFRSPGIYSVLPGETLRDLVKRAGGFTDDAYLYGSEFTRQSTQRVQQQRLNEYIDEIALQASTNSANSANRSVSALDSAAAAAAAAQSQNIVTSLRQTRASGRIVLQLHPNSHSDADLPALGLEDGDRFVVPHAPSTVSVAGAVYNPNTFLFDTSRRLRDYLELAGGANRDSEKRSIYVIRADGSVVSRRQLATWRKDQFEFLHIYPGDTIIVPLNLNKGTALRNVVDIAQIVGQFGIAAAATSVVF